MKRRLVRKEVNNKKLHERTERIKRLREEIIMGKKERLRKERVLEPNSSEKCLYNTLVGAAEEAAEKNLTRKQKDELFAELSKGNSPAVQYSDAMVCKPQVILEKALEKLGLNDIIETEYFRYNKPEDIQGKLLLTVREMEGNGPHFNLGDSQGNFLWESLEYNDEEHIKKGSAAKLRYITFEKKL